MSGGLNRLPGVFRCWSDQNLRDLVIGGIVEATEENSTAAGGLLAVLVDPGVGAESLASERSLRPRTAALPVSAPTSMQSDSGMACVDVGPNSTGRMRSPEWSYTSCSIRRR